MNNTIREEDERIVRWLCILATLSLVVEILLALNKGLLIDYIYLLNFVVMGTYFYKLGQWLEEYQIEGRSVIAFYWFLSIQSSSFYGQKSL